MRGKRPAGRPGSVRGMLFLGVLAVEAVCLAVVLLVVFGFFRPRLRQQAVEEVEASTAALATQIDIAISAFTGYSDFYIDSPELAQALNDHSAQPGYDSFYLVRDILTRMQPSGNANLRSVFLLYGNHLFTAEAGLTEGDMNMLWSDWFAYFHEEEDGLTVTPFYPSQPGVTEDDSMMCLRTFQLEGRQYILGMVSRPETLLTDIHQLADGLFDGYAMASKEGPAFFTNGEISQGEDLMEERLLEDSFSASDDTGYYIVSGSDAVDWRIMTFVSEASLNARFTPVLIPVLSMCLLVCALTLALAVPFSGWLVSPVGQLRDAMGRASRGDLSVRADIRVRNEIGQLGQYFNQMLQQIDDSQRRQLEADRRAQRMRYSLLSSQINAHYIYNTMSSINSLARLGRTEDVVRVNSALIRILQSNLRLEQDILFSTVGEEVGTVQDYWSIETIRPNNHADLTCQVDPDLWDTPILKNILQPLVENSLRHGLTDETTGHMYGEIHLHIGREGDCLSITVSDNGSGIPPDTLAALNGPVQPDEETDGHIGVTNIKKRLALAYGDRAGLTFSVEEKTLVTIRCPMETDKTGP